MAKINLATVLHNEDDSVTTEKVKDKDVPVTLRKALTRVLLSDVDKDGNPVRGDAKITRFELYDKIKRVLTGAAIDDPEEIEFTPEEIVLLREAALAFPTFVAGQIRAMLAGST